MRVLVPVDGSEQSYASAKAVAHLARLETAIIFHVVDVPRSLYPLAMPEAAEELYRTLEQDCRGDGERLLNRVVSVLPDNVGSVETRLEVGAAAERILATAEQERVDLIVMGTRGLSPLKELLFGSVSHRVVTHAPCAVLLVNRPMTRLQKVLIPVQGRDDGTAIIELFKRLRLRAPLEVEVLTVLALAPSTRPEQPSDTETLHQVALRSAQRFVEDVAARLSLVQCCAVPTTRAGEPATAILQRVAEWQPDLLVVSSRGRKGVSRFLLGSVSHKLVHLSPCPVLVCRQGV